MLAGQVKQAIGVLVVLASLCASSIAACACACTHHRPTAAAANTCHAASHASAKETVSEDVADTGCSCFVNAPSPFLSAKSKFPGDALHDGPIAQKYIDAYVVMQAASTQPEIFRPSVGYHGSVHSQRPPARAPPRL